jgi:hypothetical protein
MDSKNLPSTLRISDSARHGWLQFRDVPPLDEVLEELLFRCQGSLHLTLSHPPPGGGAPRTILAGFYEGRKFIICGLRDTEGHWITVLEAHPES